MTQATPIAASMTGPASPSPEQLSADPPATHLTVIVPESGWVSLELGELWRYRDLLMLLAWRDIAARYRQSVIGYGWAVLKPVLSMAIFTFIFSRVAGIKSDGSPYALFAFTGMLPWLYFSNTLSASTTSVVTSSNMLTKVYFPRMVLPVSSVVIGLVEFAIQSVVLAGLIVYFSTAAAPADAPSGTSQTVAASGKDEFVSSADQPAPGLKPPLAVGDGPATSGANDGAGSGNEADSDEAPAETPWRFSFGWRTLCVPLFVLMCVLSALAVGLWLTALNVKFRDVGQATPFLVQAWFYLSPIVYPSSLVSPELRPIYGMNPMVGVIEGFRWSVLGSTTPDWTMMAASAGVMGLLLISGLYYFRRTESTFADVI